MRIDANRVAATALETMLGNEPERPRKSSHGRVLVTGAAIATPAVVTRDRRPRALSALRRGGSAVLDMVESGDLLDELRELVANAVAAHRDGSHAAVPNDEDEDDGEFDEDELDPDEEDDPDDDEGEREAADRAGDQAEDDEEEEDDESQADWDEAESRWDEEHDEDLGPRPARRPPRPAARNSRQRLSRGRRDR
jgi:hypothetical protein